MKRIALHTLGCKLNFAETASIGRQFSDRGYRVVGLEEPADVVVINTCSVTERADRECRQLVRRALRKSPNAKVAVVGCYAQLRPKEVAAIDGVDFVLGTAEKYDVLRYVDGGSGSSGPMIAAACVEDIHETGVASSIGAGERTRVFLKVQDGCDYRCSYCTIPLARGESRSVPAAQVVDEARHAVERGYKEIVLTGVNVGDYGSNDAPNLTALLRILVELDGLERIRISSVEPNLLTDEFLAFWLNEKKICRHWHLPLQSGSDAILRQMRRRYLRDLYAERVNAIHAAAPEAGIGADVIVGFPGESDDLFEETYRFLLDLPVTYLHVFPYSERPNTDAAGIMDRVPMEMRAERANRLRQLGERKRRVYHEGHVGRTVDVLAETSADGNEFSGLTGEYVRVRFNAPGDVVNSVVRVRITGAASDHCSGIMS